MNLGNPDAMDYKGWRRASPFDADQSGKPLSINILSKLSNNIRQFSNLTTIEQGKVRCLRAR